jgi:protein-S-isoprenylcysteine O-methyltransferase Ste14
MEIRLAIVTAVWTLWCVQHSLLNSRGFIDRFAIPQTRIGPYYRLIYNLVSVGTLVAVVRITPRADEAWLWTWDGWLKPVQVLIFVIAIFVFVLTFRCHDFWEFLGVKPFIKSGRVESSTRPLAVHGIYGVLRHPQYTAGLMVLWARNIAATELVVNIVLSIYLIVGARMEESRFRATIGEEYERYRQKVPAFLPRRIPKISDLVRTKCR